MILLDTNIALRLADSTHKLHAVASTAIAALRSRGEIFCIVPQIIYEFWTVATRPLAVNGLGLSVADCKLEVTKLKGLVFLPDQPSLFAEWETLVTIHLCMGKAAYDARLVAAMRTHGLTQILTFNIADFRRYPGVTVIDPAAP
jgi:predicted nucleic acid-binding protein